MWNVSTRNETIIINMLRLIGLLLSIKTASFYKFYKLVLRNSNLKNYKLASCFPVYKFKLLIFQFSYLKFG